MTATTTAQIVAEARQRWDRGEPVDAVALLGEHLQVASQKSFVLEIAYEEYCHRRELGESLDASAFCRRFPTCKFSLQRRIDVHEYFCAEEEIAWPSAGDDFVRFRLIEEIGRGISSRVFIAEESDLSDRLVVVKVSTHGYREAQVLSRLDHPNVIPIHSVEIDDDTGLCVICMPFLSRWTLLDVMDVAHHDGQPPLRFADVLERLRAFDAERRRTTKQSEIDRGLRRLTFVDGLLHVSAQIADALAHTHSQGILHLDLKPTNVLITPEGRPVLLDFNLALDDAEAAEVLGGTVPYMSPEQLQATTTLAGECQTVDLRSDLFSLGVVMHQVLTGTHPFGPLAPSLPISDLANVLLERQQQKRSLSTALGRVGIDGGVSRLLAHCLRVDAAERPSSAGILARDLRRCLKLHRRAVRYAKQRPRSVAAMLALAAAIMISAAVLISTRESYPVRQFHAGIQSYQDGEYDQAVASLDRAIAAGSANPEVWAARGSAWQKSSKFYAAFMDFDEAYNRTNDPRLLVAVGYCIARLDDPTRAIYWYERALQEGLVDVRAICGLGQCYVRTQQYDKAVTCFNAALTKDESLADAYHGRAICALRVAINRQQSVPDSALRDIEMALSIGPRSPSRLENAAWMYYWHGDEKRRAKAMEFLEAAVSHGLGARSLDVWQQLPEFKGDAKLAKLRQNAGSLTTLNDQSDLLVEPFPNAVETWSSLQARSESSGHR